MLAVAEGEAMGASLQVLREVSEDNETVIEA
jgi:hypothetical protein